MGWLYPNPELYIMVLILDLLHLTKIKETTSLGLSTGKIT
jgi:hypothetical protein